MVIGCNTKWGAWKNIGTSNSEETEYNCIHKLLILRLLKSCGINNILHQEQTWLNVGEHSFSWIFQCSILHITWHNNIIGRLLDFENWDLGVTMLGFGHQGFLSLCELYNIVFFLVCLFWHLYIVEVGIIKDKHISYMQFCLSYRSTK